ncbi:MAG: hypothetical protein LUG18_07450 [Candidatus Azobacteroides sp.]|nr:hypothetical protein [Candidatus Azobacteroides sp.]
MPGIKGNNQRFVEMKSGIKTISWCLLLLMSLLFVACRDDDDDISRKDLIGEWQCIHSKGYWKEDGVIEEEWDTNQPPRNSYENDYNMVGSSCIIYADGTYRFVLAPYSSSWVGEWKVSGNTLILLDDDGDVDEIYTVVSVNRNTLILDYSYREKDDGIWYEEYGRHTFSRTDN